jgi:ATP-dependent helicase HrpA
VTNAPLHIEYPESLPVSARREEIAEAMRRHAVVIVCGETGSGKTTQLPKIALELGRAARAPGQTRGKLIGHTQPRRIAAQTVAKRIAEEMKSPLGDVVGYKVRFQDRLQPGARVKLMTDGILLAETQGDPLLSAYDTLIVDEAHERSLNIDFLLGYLKSLLPRRPDLKVVITSATIDAERFANHFSDAAGRPAPVLQVSGRLFPVEMRWRPFEETREHGLDDAIADAVDELWAGSRGAPGGDDILVFLPGEREIREVAETLRRHFAQLARGGPVPEVLPLFARLSQAEQDKVFQPHGLRRVVLATNVAETSLTVPGIRYVIDSGHARIKRYSYRNKVEMLQVEGISQAAAAQRAGRCGRVADGICIRLYGEEEFGGRPRFTDPEILRSSLAGVILRMKALKLGAVEEFPFVEAPPKKAIADGYALLAELGAVDDELRLTAIGEQLARLPLDPRVGRMILEAQSRQALAEVLVIAAGLSVQDVRDRPLGLQPQADEKHKPFDDERSEFLGTLKLWRWIEEGRGASGDHSLPQAPGTAAGHGHKLSHRQQEQRLREHFVNPRRVREWRDVHSQLHTVAAEHGWRLNTLPATYEQLHQSLLAGLLGNVGCKSDDEDWYLGARGIKFWRHPGTHLSKKPGRWLVAAELVETTRLYARGLAAIDPDWLPALAGHLIKKQLLEPHWEKKAGEVVALERATLYGIVLYSNKRVSYGRIDPATAREIFIREALVADDWDGQLAFAVHNRKLLREVQALEHKARRQDVLVDDELIFAFYDRGLPPEVCSVPTLERWYRTAAKADPQLLKLSRDELMRHEAAGITARAFPRLLRLAGIDCAAEYLHEPGHARDGVTVTVPIYALNQVEEARCEWLVPGMLEAKVLALLKTLHQRPRSRLVPLPETAGALAAELDSEHSAGTVAAPGLLDALLLKVKARTQLPLVRNDFKPEQLAPHLFMNLRVVDEHGRQLAMGRDVPGLKAQWGGQARSAFQALAALKLGSPPAESAPASNPAKPQSTSLAADPAPTLPAGQGYTGWTFGELPELLELKKGGQVLVGFPALVDKGTQVEIEVFDEPEQARARHRQGLVRLVALQLKEPLRHLEKNLPDLQRSSVLYMSLGSAEELREQMLGLAIERAFLAEPWPQDAAQFQARLDAGRPRLVLVAQEVARLAGSILVEWSAALRKLKDSRPSKEVADDIAAQLQRLVGKRFLREQPWSVLQHLPRYLQAAVLRLDKLRADPARDAQRLAELRPLEQRWLRRTAELRGTPHARLEDYRWMLEELRVSLFAQELRTPQPVSAKRLDKLWAQMES